MTTTTEDKKQFCTQLAAQLRIDSIRCTTKAGSGHPTSAMSAADLMAVLLSDYLHYDWNRPDHPNNDSLIFSKGHACPLLYAAYKAAGAISDDEMMTLRQFGSRIEGHPTPDLPWVEAATGSLGQGLPIGIGDALSGKFLDRLPYKVWVILGDSEMAEGSVWEAFAHASHYNLNNVVAIVDVNRLGQRGETMLGWNTGAYAARARAFGWNAIELDGHNLDEIQAAFEAAVHSEQPTALIARTEKGHGSVLTANKEGMHGKALSEEDAQKAIAEISERVGGRPDVHVEVQKPADQQPATPPSCAGKKVDYKMGDKVATRQAYGDALVALSQSDPAVVVLDGEVSNSTMAEEFKDVCPDRFFEMYIAEQQMVSAACGLQNRRKKPFCSTFAAFYARAYDQIRMSAVSRADIKLCGSHAGVSIGADGPSQMALEDIAMLRAVCGSTVLYPSDATSTAALVQAMSDISGIVFLRTTREKTPVLYQDGTKFPVGGSKTLRSSDDDQATIIGAGITLHEALKAADELQGQNTKVRVIDLYSVKPIDVETLRKAARETGHLIVVEDHWKEGGLGEAVLAALAGDPDVKPRFTHLAVHKMPTSGEPQELMDAQGITAKHIVAAVRGDEG
jgi:transketolase